MKRPAARGQGAFSRFALSSMKKEVPIMARFDIAEFFALRDRDWQGHDAEALTAGHSVAGEIVSPLF
jgi:hypothetical protein